MNEGTPLHTRLFDLACVAPLIVIFLFAVYGQGVLIRAQWPYLHARMDYVRLAGAVASLAFFALQIALFFLRRLPSRKSDGPWPRAVALLGANFNFALLLLHGPAVSNGLIELSLALTLAGTLGSLLVLSRLGRSFSIFPEARGLVTAGPYRLVRHPLYLMEIVSTLGIALRYWQLAALLIALVTIAFQVWRTYYEEAVLREAYPEYADYAQRTARLIPGVY